MACFRALAAWVRRLRWRPLSRPSRPPGAAPATPAPVAARGRHTRGVDPFVRTSWPVGADTCSVCLPPPATKRAREEDDGVGADAADAAPAVSRRRASEEGAAEGAEMQEGGGAQVGGAVAGGATGGGDGSPAAANGGEDVPAEGADDAEDEAAEGELSGETPRARRVRELGDEIAKLEGEIAQIEAGDHPEVETRKKVFESVRREALERAEYRKQLALEVAEAMLKYEKTAADDVFRDSCEEVKRLLKEGVRDQLQLLKEKMEDMTNTANARKRSTRKLRSKTKKEDDGKEEDPVAAARAVADASLVSSVDWVPPISQHLSEPEILSDLKQVHSEWKDFADRFSKTPMGALLPVETSVNALRIGEDTFTKGERVVVTSELTHEDFFCTLASIGAGEIGLRLNDGSRSRLPISLLEQRRCVITRQASREEEDR